MGREREAHKRKTLASGDQQLLLTFRFPFDFSLRQVANRRQSKLDLPSVLVIAVVILCQSWYRAQQTTRLSKQYCKTFLFTTSFADRAVILNANSQSPRMVRHLVFDA